MVVSGLLDRLRWCCSGQMRYLPNGHADAVGKVEASLVVRELVLCVHLGEQVGFIWTRPSPPADLSLGVVSHHATHALERIIGKDGAGTLTKRVSVVVIFPVFLRKVGCRKAGDVDGWAGRGRYALHL